MAQKELWAEKSLYPHWWRDKREQWFHDRLEETGLAKEIRDSFAGLRSSDDLKKEREELEELEALRLQRLRELTVSS